MSEIQVRAKLGAQCGSRGHCALLDFVVTRLHYRLLDIDFQRLEGKPVVIRVLTTHAGERTASGSGRLARRSRKPGSRFTMFWISARQCVALVSVSLVVKS